MPAPRMGRMSVWIMYKLMGSFPPCRFRGMPPTSRAGVEEDIQQVIGTLGTDFTIAGAVKGRQLSLAISFAV